MGLPQYSPYLNCRIVRPGPRTDRVVVREAKLWGGLWLAVISHSPIKPNSVASEAAVTVIPGIISFQSPTRQLAEMLAAGAFLIATCTW